LWVWCVLPARPSGIADYQSRFWGVVGGDVCFLAEFGFLLGIGWGIDSFGDLVGFCGGLCLRLLVGLESGLIATAFRLLQPFGLRALRLSSIAGAIDQTL
tara:strand:- start:643 stop:942 length:300 start_codon:yes stop_codon:yes gene_type:complete